MDATNSAAELVMRPNGASLFITAPVTLFRVARSVYHGAGLSIPVARSA
jgi:hypothetical protein